MCKDYYDTYIDCDKILKLNNIDRINMANKLAEGNEDLKDLLLICWNNNIKTFSCCRGHDTFYPQLSFELDGNNSFTLANALLNHQDDFTFSFSSKNLGIFKDPSLQAFIFVIGDTNANSKYNSNLFKKINNLIHYNDFSKEEVNPILIHAMNINKLLKNTKISSDLTIVDDKMYLSLVNYGNYIAAVDRKSTTINDIVISDLKKKQLNAYIDQEITNDELINFLNNFYKDYDVKCKKKLI